MESILNIQSDEPVDITYLGIGSCPHVGEGQKLDPKVDQLIPSCLHDSILLTKKPMRIVHIDPLFDRYKSFLDTYFKEYNVIPIDIPYGYRWMSDTLDILVIPDRIEHKDHLWFFEGLVDIVLNTKGKLLIQEYTGYEVKELNQHLYDTCAQKEKYKRRILLDMTFGTDTGCSTDMIKAEPLYDSRGDFLNLQFLSHEEVKRWAGTSPKLDELFQKKYRANYLQTLNTMHVDYRRKMKGESLMYGSPEYSEASSPDDIMGVLQKKLYDCLEILLRVKGADAESKQKLDSLCKDYKMQDPYKWYDVVNKLVLRP